jgi:hypothetical protein
VPLLSQILPAARIVSTAISRRVVEVEATI